MVKQESRSRSRSTARRSRMQSAETRSPASVRSRAQSDPETSPSRETSPRDIEQDAMSSTEIEVQSDGNTSETSDRPKRRRGYRGSRAFFKAQVPPSRPVVLADDEKARKILLPTINSLLSRMDGLLDTLRRSRQNQWIIPGENDSDGSAISRGTSPSRSRSRSRRPPTAEGYRQPASQRDENRPNNSDHDSAPRSSKRKRDPTLSNVADPKSASETDHPPEESVDAQNDQGPQKRKRKRRGANKVPTLRLRDWSEVLGLASMTGWDAAIIDRAAKRCSALFGESMAFRTLHEEGSEKPPDDPVQYTPDLIFAPKPLDNDIEAANSSSERPYWEQGAQRCPHVGCFGNQEDYFPIAYRAVEHCKKHHGYDPRDQENQSTPMLGAIHEDGFLQPIPLQRGWRGGDKDNSEKRLKHAVERTSRRTSRN
jgi:N-terminal acetyltransferase B complex catalytic subunit